MKLKRVLKVKMSGDDVKFLQEELKKYSFYKKNITGKFGNETRLAVIEFQNKIGLKANGEVGMQTWDHLLDFNKSKKKSQIDIPNKVVYVNENFKIYDNIIDDKYCNKYGRKNTIWITSTGTSYRPDMFINNWKPFYKMNRGVPAISDDGGYITLKTGYNYIIGGRSKDDKIWDGKILQVFNNDRHWANNVQDENISSKSISIAVCNLGPLVKINGEFYNNNLIKVDSSEVINVNYNGYEYWHKYTNLQIKSLFNLITHLKNKYKIDILIDDNFLKYDLHKYTEGGLRTDSNCIPGGIGLFPQREINDMLNKL